MLTKPKIVRENVRNLNQSILVLIAALNEEKGIVLTLSDIRRYIRGCHFLVMDGNSDDQTVSNAKKLGAEVICRRDKGKGDAIRCALESINEKYEYIVLIDGDFTYPAKHIPEMIDILENNPSVGMVSGNRFNHNNSGSNKVLNFGNKVLALAHNMINGVRMQDPLSGLRVIRGNLIENWRPKSLGFDVEVELNHHVECLGFQISEIDISYRKRVGEKKLKIRHGFFILKRIINQNLFYN